jgi:hypothetical protein
MLMREEEKSSTKRRIRETERPRALLTAFSPAFFQAFYHAFFMMRRGISGYFRTPLNGLYFREARVNE